MIATDEDALICDFAETYRIYDIYRYPVEYIAILAAGLRQNSRIMMAVNGLKTDIDTLLLARIADSSAINVWFQTEDAKRGNNRPKSLVAVLTGTNQDENMAFETGKDFIEEWRRLNE